MLVAVLLGAGNSLFHVWGGKQTVVKTGNDIRALGVFVSTGALGLAVGLVFFSWALLYGLLLAIMALAVIYVRWDNGESMPVTDFTVRSSWFTPVRIWTLVVALMLFVGDGYLPDELHDACYALSGKSVTAGARGSGFRTPCRGSDTWLSVGCLFIEYGADAIGAAVGDDRDRVGRVALHR